MKLKTYFLFILFVFGGQFFVQAQTSISDARAKSEGSAVTIEGVVTNGSELGIIRYVQDETGGIAVYPGNGSVSGFADKVKLGDKVKISGSLKDYRGLLEIDPITFYEVLSSGNEVSPLVTGDASIVKEANEGKLVKIENVTFDNPGTKFAENDQYQFSAGGVSSVIYLRRDHPLANTTIPSGKVDLIGIVSQYQDSHQLLPRGPNDIIKKGNIEFTDQLDVLDLDKESVTLKISTNENTSVEVLDDEGKVWYTSPSNTIHEMVINGLTAATTYKFHVAAKSGDETIKSAPVTFITKSLSSGKIGVYFNRSSLAEVSTTGEVPKSSSGSAVLNKIIGLIDSATMTVDVALYNFNSGELINALVAAQNRGVTVRYVGNKTSSNFSLDRELPFYTAFETDSQNSNGIMHNKFFVIDRASVDRSFVITGSMNLTPNNINDDRNNTLVIQDQSLAKVFTVEMNELFGSMSEKNDDDKALFGNEKADNTAHYAKIGDVFTKIFFSPSDGTTAQILNELKTAEKNIQIGILNFTRNELGSALVEAKKKGVDTRIIINDFKSPGSEYDYLVESQVNVQKYDKEDNTLHHKYAIIDEGTDKARVITGSHNWTSAAEERNDENTLVLYDKTIANLFMQEFEAAWCEVTNQGCLTSLPLADFGAAFSVYPNPSSRDLQLKWEDMGSKNNLYIYDAMGKMVQFEKDHQDNRLSVAHLPNGAYFIILENGAKRVGTRFVKQ